MTTTNLKKDPAHNVFGEALISCSVEPLTGFFRDGCCNTNDADIGCHTVCAIMTREFLEFSKASGNDLSTPRPEFGFAGLKEGDRWCLCAGRWAEAAAFGKAPKLYLEATHIKTLDYVSLDQLKDYAVDLN